MTKAETALAELTEISSQIEAAVLVDGKGAVSASTLSEERAARLASSAREALESAEQVRDGELTQLEVASEEGSLFVVRQGDRLIAATTGPEPTAGLVFYDLRSALRKATERKKPTKQAKTSGSS
jgi:predicted regulator of Ras-like GTPase activity (Roadblock/LC7/MglB family)